MDYDKYRNIRPLIGEEISQAIATLSTNDALRRAYEILGLPLTWEQMLEKLSGCTSTEDFRLRLGYLMVKRVVETSCTSLTLSGQEHITPQEGYTYISNHRDIILDSAFLNVLLHDAGARIPQIAIGDNLMVAPWVETLVKLNGSFLVRRNLKGREVLLSAKLLSEYMHDVSREGGSMWIAQREGRAKDSSDHTQPALLKMLAMGGGQDLLASLGELNIVPLTCSYEFDPCDYLKAREMQLKRDDPQYSKTPADDALNMQTGIFGYKGRVHFALGRPLSSLLEEVDWSSVEVDRVEYIAGIMDREIYRGYRLYPCNYIAWDMLHESREHGAEYSTEDVMAFERYLAEQLARIEMPEGIEPDEPFLRACLLTMYANPAINHYLINHYLL